MAEQALGQVEYTLRPQQSSSYIFRRSLFVVQDVKAGESLTADNVRSIRPGHGLPPRHYEKVLGRRARTDIARNPAGVGFTRLSCPPSVSRKRDEAPVPQNRGFVQAIKPHQGFEWPSGTSRPQSSDRTQPRCRRRIRSANRRTLT